ncbi:MAG: hypothetical protein KatS3mg111_0911 [Pirellulaceae bacterium]|nr:MAG: hypothetical protein KatS3mg111_0911 [Pirellulaceae bacterium]
MTFKHRGLILGLPDCGAMDGVNSRWEYLICLPTRHPSCLNDGANPSDDSEKCGMVTIRVTPNLLGSAD